MKLSDPGAVPSFQRFLRQNQLVFACAESCTGGLLSKEMTALAGSSDVFWGGAVTYANGAKVHILGVPEELIAQNGAVSAVVAESMVQGLVRLSGVPLAVAITGVAGPGGGSPEKPVGTVWFGLAASRDGAGRTVAVRHRFEGARRPVQIQAARWARVLATLWWESRMELDSLQSLADNVGKPFVEAFQAPSSFYPNSF